MNSDFNRTSAFYYDGHYDPAMTHLDCLTSGIQPFGEGFNLGPLMQPAFKGKVLVVTGQKDPTLCRITPMDWSAYKDTRVMSVNAAFSGKYWVRLLYATVRA